MRRVVCIAAIWCLPLAAIAQPAAPLGVHGFDERQDTWHADLDSYPLRAVGQVRVAYDNGLATCSGTLIAPDVVVTAAHCLAHPAHSAARPEQVQFWLRYNAAAIPDTHKYTAEALYWPEAWQTSREIAADYGLVRLTRRTQEDGVALAAMADTLLATKPDLLLVGYPGSKGGRVFFTQSYDYQLAQDNRLLLHRGDIEAGQSGGAVFAGNQVIGVHSMAGDKANISVLFDEDTIREIKRF